MYCTKEDDEVLNDVIVKEIKFDYREAESDVAAKIKDWTNDGYQVEVFYDGSATTSVLLVAKKFLEVESYGKDRQKGKICGVADAGSLN